MIALCTAEVSPRIAELESVINIVYEGWAVEQKILSEEQMVDLMQKHQPDILITSYDPITKAVIDRSSNLKMIVCTRANPVNVDYQHAKEKGILISYSPGRNSDCTAEYTVAMMLSIMRKIPMAFHALKLGEHTSQPDENQDKEIRDGLRRDVTWSLGTDTPYILYKGTQMRGKTLGIIGYGSIGERVANICRGFGMKIIAFDPYYTKTPIDFTLVNSLDELAQAADIVTVHCKDTPDTYHIINAAFLKNMKPTSFLINTSRGVMVDEHALIDALLTHQIAGAALDVFDSEPIAADHPFLTKCNNIVVTPHLAGATTDAIDNHTIQLLEDINHFLRGEPLEFEYR